MLRYYTTMQALFVAVLCFWASISLAAQGADGPVAPVAREVQVASESFRQGVPVPGWAHPLDIQPSTRTAPVVVLLADAQLQVADVPATFINRAVQVNDRASLGVIGQISFDFEPSYQKLHLHRVRILRGDEVIDHTQTVGIRFLQRETALEAGQYSGIVSALLVLNDVRVGDVLHVMYTIEGENPVFGGKYSAFAAWDDSRPIDLRSVTLIYPPTRRIAWRMLGDFRPAVSEPQIQDANGNRVLRWEERAIEGIDPENNVPPTYFAYRMLQFSEYPDWNSVAIWADELFARRGGLTGELKGVVDRLRQLPTDEAKVVGALQWVQDKVRYFSISLGESSHRPRQPAAATERRSGDCKDKTNLLLALLRELGIPARAVLASLRADKSPSKFLPSPQAFDHAVVQVKVAGVDRYVDGTLLGQVSKLERMGTLPHGAQVLVADRNATDLQVIDVPNRLEMNTVSLNERITLRTFSEPGNLLVNKSWNGLAAEAARLAVAQMSPQQLGKFALSSYEQRYPGIELDGVPKFADDPEQNRVTMTSAYRVPNPAKEVGGDWIFRFFPDNLKGIFSLPQQGNRRLPLVPMPYPYAAQYHLEVEWPDGVAMMWDPFSAATNSDLFRLEVSRAFRGNRFKLDLRFTPNVESISAAQVPQFLADIKEFDRLVGGTVIVDRAAIKSEGFLGIGKKTMVEIMQTRLQSTIAQIGKAIAAGRLSGHDLARAHCDRAEALADIGKAAEGLKDADEAVKLAPDLGRAWVCRGNLLFASGLYAKAVADYGKALSLGEGGFYPYYRRGHANFYLGRLPDALNDFVKAVAESSDESDSHYARLWQAWTTQRLKRDLPQDLTIRMAKEPTGAWPLPAAAMLVGALTPEQLVEEINKKQGDERELVSAEAYFYLGQYYLVHDKTAEAVQAFKQVREKGISMYIEHVAAGFELDRLGQAR
ncbi:MAG: DUF3857 domain-containing protein [Rhodocyclales bacterium]|nr:DUF3857 domain-containing protein [Rhodocyclales bacterium]